MDAMPIAAVRSLPFSLSEATVPARATTEAPEANPYTQGDQGPDKGGLSAALRQKLTGKIPGAIPLESLSLPDVPTLRAAAVQAREPRGTTHDEALRVRRAALVQLQTGAQSGSPVAAVATANLAILDGGTGASHFRHTVFTDRALAWVATADDKQFAIGPGVTIADGLRAMAKGLTETRGADPTSDGPIYQAALAQAASLATPGSYVASLVQAHETLAKQISSPRDKAQLAEQALNELTTVTAFDVLAGGGAKALRAVARQANWTLTMTDAERITLKSAALRTIAGMSAPTSRAAHVANDALRLVAGATSLTEQDTALKNALDILATAGDADF
jgi:hypothetical protein